MISFNAAMTLVGLAFSSGTRSSLTLLIALVLARLGWVEVPEPLAFMTSTPMLGMLCAVAAVEEWAARDEDAEDLLAALQYAVHGAGAALTALVMDDGPLAEIPPWAAVLIAVVLSIATLSIRRKIARTLTEFASGLGQPRKWLAWLETGGVVGLLAAVVLFPALVLGFVVAAVLLGALVVGVAKARDASLRRPCGSCGHAARREASRCPACRHPLAVVTPLG